MAIRPPKETIRITVRITDLNSEHVWFSVWVDGVLICAPGGGLCLRVEEAPAFFRRLRPFKLDVTDIAKEDLELVMFGPKNI